MKLVQDKVLMEKCWASHWELHTESNLVLRKYQGWFYKVATLGLQGLATLRVQDLERVLHWEIKKELGLKIN